MADYSVAYNQFGTLLSNLSANTTDTPYEIEITSVTTSFMNPDSNTGLSKLLKRYSNRYVILSWGNDAISTIRTITDGYEMFAKCDTLVGISLSGFENITSAISFFSYCVNLKRITNLNMSSLTNALSMFGSCTRLTEIDTSSFRNVTNAEGMFSGCSSLVRIDTNPFANITNAKGMFSGCTALERIDISFLSAITNSSYLFYDCYNLQVIIGINLPNVTNAEGMFYYCRSLERIDISSMSNLVDIVFYNGGLFCHCEALKYVALPNPFNITDVTKMFENCISLERITLPNMSSVTNATSMFLNCSCLEEIHGWSIPLTATMTDCFKNCDSLQAIYVPEVAPQESTWHAWEMSKDTVNSQTAVKVYDLDGTSVSVNVPSSGDYTLRVTDKVDELLFSPSESISASTIQKMLQTKAPITGNVNALDPTKDNFVMFAKDRTAAKTNITTDVVEVGNMLPPTSAAVYAAIDANKSGGIPLGGWTSFENDTAPNDEWLQAGTTFDPDTYPEAFLYLGGNTVPQRFDHSRRGDFESITISTNSASPTVILKDGFLIISSMSSAKTYFYLNGILTVQTPIVSNGGGANIAEVEVKKGDEIYCTGNTAIFAQIAYYTHPMFIKATTTASSYTPSSAVQEIKDYTKDYVDAKNSYSTEETLTGGTWIDGKPIYKRTWSFSSFSSTEGIIDSSGTYDKIISQQGFMIIGSQIIPVAQNRSADGITLRIPNTSQHNLAYIKTTGVSSADITIEYTKTTD